MTTAWRAKLCLMKLPKDDLLGTTRVDDARHGTGDGSGGLANSLQVERMYAPDWEAILSALRVVLGLPKPEPPWAGSNVR